MNRVVACMSCCAFVAAAQQTTTDWPQARGPAGDGHADASNLALPWPEGKPALLWRVALGNGYSGVSEAEGRLYTQVQTRAGQYVVCLEAATGRLLWQSRYNYPWEQAADYPGPYATPTFSAGKLYFTDCYGFAGCLDARNGKTLWTVNLTEAFGGQGTGFGYACSPLVEEGHVFLPVGGKGASLMAFSAQDGSVLWRTGDDAASYASSFMIRVEGHRQVVSFLQNLF
jgi:outer membrane protein assembly factor BamB